MAGIETLNDDFALPLVDTSKWTVTGSNYTIASPNGFKFTVPSQTGVYTTLQSVDQFNLHSRAIYWQNTFDSIRNGYAKMCITTPTGIEHGFTITSREAKDFGNVAEVMGSSTIKVSGETWTDNQWKDSYLTILSTEYRILSNAAIPNSTDRTITIDGTWIDTPSVGTGFSINTSEIKLYSKTAAGVVTYHKVLTWNESNFRWLKLSSLPSNRLFWWTSNDGVNWALRDYKSGVLSSEISSVRFMAQLSNVHALTTPYPESMTIKYVNTRKAIFRGSGYLSTNMNTIRPGTIPNNQQYDVFYGISGSLARIQNRQLAIRSSAVRTNLRSTIRDVELQFDVKLTAATSGTIFWRSTASTDDYVGLQIYPTRIVLVEKVDNVITDLQEYTIDNDAGVTYAYKVIHAGSTVVVYRNEGDYESTGLITFPVEKFRRTGVSTVNSKGHIGFTASTSDVIFDNLIVRSGITPPALTGTSIGTLGTLPLPPEWPYDTSQFVGRIEYMKLTEPGYNDLWLWPTPALNPAYGGFLPADYDLGWADHRAYSEELSSVSGTINYTQLHGAKTIGLTIGVVPGTAMSVNDLCLIFDSWFAPHRRPVLIYKPVGQSERFVNLVPTPLGRPVPIEQHNLFTVLTASWIVPSGVEEDSAPKQVTLDPEIAESSVVTTEGSAVSLPKFYVYGPFTEALIVNDTLDITGSARLQLTGTVEDGEFIEIDTRKRTVRYMGSDDEAANRRNMLTVRGWFGLHPYNNNIRFESLEGTGMVIIEWRNAYH